jgi:hypothetical protein
MYGAGGVMHFNSVLVYEKTLHGTTTFAKVTRASDRKPRPVILMTCPPAKLPTSGEIE